MKIRVCRNPEDVSCTEIELDKISRFRWSNISGGYHIRTGRRFYLYGDVDYNWAAANLNGCSGSHGYKAYAAKVMIPEWANKNDPRYARTYKYLMLKYPKTYYRKNTISKMIFDCLTANKKMSRNDLMNAVLEKSGKPKATISQAIKRLYDEGIVCSDCDKGQDRNYWLFTQKLDEETK